MEWSSTAEDQLTEIWMNAVDPQRSSLHRRSLTENWSAIPLDEEPISVKGFTNWLSLP